MRRILCVALSAAWVATGEAWAAPAAEVSCVGGVTYDDGSFESGYRIPFAADARFVQRFTPSAYPATLTHACACWANTDAAGMAFNFVFYRDDGLGGQPGTLVGTLPGTVLAGSFGQQMYKDVDCTDTKITIDQGSIWVGTEWNAASNFHFFICADTSPSTPQATALKSDNAGLNWTPVEFIDPAFRALGIRAVIGAPVGTKGGCKAGENIVCLGNGRFRVEVDWRNQFNGAVGRGLARPQSDVTAFFAFDNKDNIELILKVLDFGGVFKVFYGELTDLDFTLRITDGLTGNVRVYSNTPGDCGGIDQNAFSGSKLLDEANGRLLTAERKDFPANSASGSCRGDQKTLCLLNHRFAVTVAWMNQFNGASGPGNPHALSDLTGAFSFTDASNLELLFKMIDFGDRVAVFYGTLSNLQYTAIVTDTLTGQFKTYANPPGNFCGGLDNNAFPP
jgi:hypothetical protein